MRILSIETSCDETAISVVEAEGEFPNASYRILGNALFSQIDIHREYGGVFPAVAKREHAKTVVPMLEKALREAGMLRESEAVLDEKMASEIRTLVAREGALADELVAFLQKTAAPDIDLVAVTHGPGLEPALWVGVNFAKALALAWQKPLLGINHMEAHLISSLYADGRLRPVAFPALALLISGGHTELVLMREWGEYELVGATRDDAVGEAFDKAARMLGLPYPGGPEISRLAAEARRVNVPRHFTLPRPMLDSGDLDFSFSGLKTAVRYALAEKTPTDEEKLAMAREFEDAVMEVLLKKSLAAVEHYGARTLIVGGGVSANTFIRASFEQSPELASELEHCYFPERALATDNAVMIALAAHAKADTAATAPTSLTANGNLAF